ncbi:MAG: hypothetical protein F4X44_00935 [Gammaproteobacteria bacterium]|nr:hypothetical protein [Gammaproteobacteria bacterium]
MDYLVLVIIVLIFLFFLWFVFVNLPNRQRLRKLDIYRIEILRADLAREKPDIPDVKLVEAALLSQLLGKIVGHAAEPSMDEAREIDDFIRNLGYRYIVSEQYISENISNGKLQDRTIKEIATSLWLNSFDSSKVEAGSEHPWIDFHMKNLVFVLDMIGFYVFASGSKMDEKEKAFVEIARVFKWTEKDLQQSLYNWKNRLRI